MTRSTASLADVEPVVAPPLTRLAAGLFDAALLASVDGGVVFLTLRLAGLDMPSCGALPLAPLTGFLVLLNAGYVVLLTLAGGQTLGKMACRLRVVDRAGGPVGTTTAVIRTIGYLVSVLPLGVGFVWMVRDTERRALHDRLAGTRVVRVFG